MNDIAPMSLDDNIGPVEATPAKDTDGVPYCRKHHCRMSHTSSGKKGSPTAYYKCPVPKCDQKAQKIKTLRESVVPPQPLKCQHCAKAGNESFCERDDRLSTAAMVILRCGLCGWKSNALAVPQLAAAHFARRPPATNERLGDR